MIKKVRLKNWKSHLESELNFYPGTNLIVGIMGSGKSSVMDAISFAFFGTFPNLMSKKTTLDDVVMKRPLQATEAEVELFFEASGSQYSIIRRIKKGKGTIHAEIRKGEALLDVNPDSVTALVEKILQIDYQLFSRAVYSEQNNIDYFLSIPKGKRMEHIDRMLKVDEFEAVRERAQKIKNSFADILVEKKKVLVGMEKDELAGKKERLEKELGELTAKRKFVEETAKKQEAEKEKLEEEIEKIELKKDELADLKAAFQGVKSALAEINGREKEIAVFLEGKDKLELPDKIKEIESDFSLVKGNMEKIDSELISLRADAVSAGSLLMDMEKRRIPDIAERLADRGTGLAELEKLQSELGTAPEKVLELAKEKSHAIRAEIIKAESRILEIKKSLEQLHGSDKCPVCDNDLASGKRESLLKSRHTELDELGTLLAVKREQMAVVNITGAEAKISRLKILEERAKGISKLRGELEQAKAEAASLKEKTSLIIPEIEKFSTERRSLEEKLNLIDREKSKAQKLVEYFGEMERILAKKSEQLGKFAILEKKLAEAEVAVDFEKLELLTKTFRGKISEIAAAKAALYHMENEAKMKGEILADVDKRLAVLEAYKAETVESEKIISWLEKFSRAVAMTQDELRTSFLYTVNNIMGRMWKKIYPYEDIEDIRLVIDSDYILQFKSGENWLPVDGVASGGERSLACLALRIAFSLAFIPNLKWLILDEPTHNLDTAAIQQFASVLGESMEKIVNQTFLITHENRIAEAIDCAVYRLERDKSKHEATKVVGGVNV